MEISLSHFRELEALGIAQPSQYNITTIQVPNDEWFKGDFVVINEGENAGSVATISTMSSNRIKFPEDEANKTYEVYNECSLNFLTKVGDPKTWGWKLDDGLLTKVTLNFGGKEITNMAQIDNMIEDACYDAISGMKFKTPYDIEIKHNVELIPEMETV